MIRIPQGVAAKAEIMRQAVVDYVPAREDRHSMSGLVAARIPAVTMALLFKCWIAKIVVGWMTFLAIGNRQLSTAIVPSGLSLSQLHPATIFAESFPIPVLFTRLSEIDAETASRPKFCHPALGRSWI